MAITDLVAARNLCQDNGGKRLRNSNQSYKHVIASLQLLGVNISYEAMKKRVKRASLENRATDLSEQSVVSSLSSPSLTSEDTAETTADEHQLVETAELLFSFHAGRPRGSTKAKKKQDLSDASKCTDAIVLEFSRKIQRF